MRTTHSRALRLFLLAALAAATVCHATPPTPPAQIVFTARDAAAEAQSGDGVFVLPARIRLNDYAGNLEIRVRVIAENPLKPEDVDRNSYRVEGLQRGKKEAGVDVRIGVQRKPGRYRVEVELVSSGGERAGVLDRQVFYQVVERERARLVWPQEARRLDQQSRQQAFQDQLRRNPDRPDLKLLDPGLISVPDGLARKIVADDRVKLLVRASGPDATLKRFVVDHTGDSWRERDPITVRGQLVYLDFEGTWRPLHNVSVNIYDEDTFGDEHLGTVGTDSNGNWSFPVNNDDGWLQDGRDIYVRMNLGNTRFEVRDADSDQYRWQSSTHEDLDDGTIIDFGSQTGGTNATAMQVFGVINRGWNHIVSSGGQDPGYIEVRHPTSKTNHQSGVVNVTSGDVDGPDSILHEYGHALMYRAFGNTSISPGGAHGFNDDTQDPGLAYSEGWATGYMLSLCPDGQYNWHEGSDEDPGEWPTCTTQNDPDGRSIENFADAGNRVGENTEGRVAAALNDFRDSANDTNGGSENRGRNGESDGNSGSRIPLSSIYRDSMWGFTHDDFMQFWFTFAGNVDGTARARADDIMQYNWMSLPVEVSCVASKVTASLSKEPEPLLTGLRAFRDHALKPTSAGRRWIQLYYSNSPELAMILIRDPGARQAALAVIEHFSRLGAGFAKHAELERLVAANQAVLPDEVAKSIETIARAIERRGSPELRRDLGVFREELATLSRLTVAQAVQRAEREPNPESTDILPPVRPNQLNQGSRKVDWRSIRKYMPRTSPEPAQPPATAK